MYVYIETEKGLYTVGFYGPDGRFLPESDHDSVNSAAERVHYLNGGDEPVDRFDPVSIWGS
jgi:hypothetical protein